MWLAALPVVYVISPLSLLALPTLRRWPRAAWWLTGLYALSQQLPALLSPEPLLASVLALVRTLLLLGLLAVGAVLGSSDRLRPLAFGLGLTFLVAGLYSASGGVDFTSLRLRHPYMTAVTLGLSGAAGLWLALFLNGRLLWRVPLGLAAVGVLVLSGSRGPLLAALVGSAAAFLFRQRRERRPPVFLLLGTLLLAGGVYAGQQREIFSLTRLMNLDTSGRDLIWADTLSVIRAQPWSGVGSYRLGARLTPPGDACVLWSGTVGARGGACPNWVPQLGNPWRVAHNVTLQQLAETGPLGLLGLFVLLAVVLSTTLARRDPLSVAVVVGLLAATLTDNTLVVPSPFFAELFWIVAGMQLTALRPVSTPMALTASAAILLLAFPLLVLVGPGPRDVGTSLTLLSAPTQVSEVQGYTVYTQFRVPPGNYRASLRACQASCVTLRTVPFTTTTESTPVLTLQADLLPVTQQRVELRLHRGGSTVDLRPMGTRSWSVKRKPTQRS